MVSHKLFLIIPTLKQGGAERVMSELANTFIQSKEVSEVHLVLLAKSDDFYKIDPGIIIHRLSFENTGRLGKILSELKTLISLRKLFKTRRPDAVLCFMEKYNVFTIIASSFLGLKVFVSDRSNPLKKTTFKLSFLRWLTYGYAAGIIAQTELAKQVLFNKTKNKNIIVIPNPIKEIEFFPNIQRENIILNVGRLVPEKGQKYLIEVISQLEGSKNWKVVILGDGPLRSKLEEQVNTFGLNKQVQFLGAVNNVDEWLARASVFVFPSISEGFPNALAEAMIAGLPCVSFDCDTGPKDLIVNGVNGYLTAVYDVKEFASKLEDLVLSETLRNKISLEAVKIVDRLHIVTIGDKYLKFFFK